jgi:hypothetical protein
LRVLHRCDHPACVNPAHLFLGTQKDNMQDAKSKNRTTQGRRNAMAKLTSEDVLAIRIDSRTHADIAATYHISQSSISLIKSS